MSQISYWKVLTRKKTLPHDHEIETKLNRKLGTYDLTALGIGATLGVGVYVLAGHVAKDQAGPSVVLSFFIAAFASLLSGLCYAEFGARVPKAGSAYIYSYVCIGEFAAFIIGWNLILEYVIGSASVCRGISLYLDTLINNTLKTTFSEIAPIEWGFLGSYFDFFACTLAIVFGVGLAFGIQTSAFLNNFCTIINIGVVIFVIIAGSIKANIANWQIDPSQLNTTDIDPNIKLGVGGFFPFGFEGTLRGAATCFFGFVGFDCIATTGEEVKEPRRAIPRAILFSLLIIFLSYFGVSTVLTLMWPYYLQDVDAPLPYAFGEIGWETAKWIVTIGGMLGLISSLLGALLPLPRIIYAMSQDGLVFRFLGIVSPKFKTPVIGSIFAAFLTGFFAGIFDLTQLVNMLSIGTLLAYTVIGICLTILRFMDNSVEYLNIESKSSQMQNEVTNLVNSNENRINSHEIMMQIFNIKRLSVPTYLSTTIVTVMLIIYCACAFGFSLTIMYASNEIVNLTPWALILLCLFGIINIIIVLAISVQPREGENPYFKVPLVPLIPAISIFVNIYLMLQLDIYTWIRFAIWMIIGLIIYLPCICIYDRTRSKIMSSKHNSYSYQEQKSIPFNENDNSNHVNQVNNILQLTNDTIILDIKNELDQNSSNETIKSNKTSSPKQSLDEIVLESEFSDSLTEMKHSNGDRYLVEHTNSKSNQNDLEDFKINENSNDDTKSVLDILDNVLQEEESVTYNNTNRKISVDSEQIPSFIDISTAVLVHRPSDTFKEESENEIVNNLNSGSKDSGIEQDTEIQIEQNLNDNKLIDENNENKIIDLEISMATANPELVDLIKDDSNFESEPNLDIEQVLIPGSNLLINSPKISKSNKISNKNPNLTNETPRQSINSEKEQINLVKEINENTEEKLNNSNAIIISNIDTSNKPNKTNESSDEEKLSNTIKDNSITNQENPIDEKIPSPKITRTLIPLKPSISPTLSRKSSTSSIKSSYENPLHSESFKRKLSKLMGQNTILKVNNIPSPQPPTSLPPHNTKPNSNEFESKPSFTTPQETKIPSVLNIEEQPSLKPSKSENDVMRLVLSDIKDLPSKNNKNTNESKELSKTINENKIPKPPKFDPILYKTLGANFKRHSKDRPKLEELIGKNINTATNNVENQNKKIPNELISKIKENQRSEINDNKTNELINMQKPETPEQFKKKLAAIIQRGPSYKIQRQYNQPEILGSTKINASPTNNDKNTHKNNYADVLKSIQDSKKSISNLDSNNDERKNSIIKKLSSNSNNEQINLDNVRKSLKSIN